MPPTGATGIALRMNRLTFAPALIRRVQSVEKQFAAAISTRALLVGRMSIALSGKTLWPKTLQIVTAEITVRSFVALAIDRNASL